MSACSWKPGRHSEHACHFPGLVMNNKESKKQQTNNRRCGNPIGQRLNTLAAHTNAHTKLRSITVCTREKGCGNVPISLLAGAFCNRQAAAAGPRLLRLLAGISACVMNTRNTSTQPAAMALFGQTIQSAAPGGSSSITLTRKALHMRPPPMRQY